MGKILLLVVLALVVAYVVVGMVVARRVAARRAVRRRRDAAIAARADEQNEWFLAGDLRGIYGGEPDPDPPLESPPPLHDIPKPPPDRSWIEFTRVPIAGRIDPVTGRKETIYKEYEWPGRDTHERR
jgi:hypothetical protein